MANHSSGYKAVMTLSKCRRYEFGGIESDWLDVVYACYLVQKDIGTGQYWTADLVTDKLREIRPGHGWFPGLAHLATEKYRILEVKHEPVGIGEKTEPWYKIVDPNGVVLALRELEYLE